MGNIKERRHFGFFRASDKEFIGPLVKTIGRFLIVLPVFLFWIILNNDVSLLDSLRLTMMVLLISFGIVMNELMHFRRMRSLARFEQLVQSGREQPWTRYYLKTYPGAGWDPINSEAENGTSSRNAKAIFAKAKRDLLIDLARAWGFPFAIVVFIAILTAPFTPEDVIIEFVGIQIDMLMIGYSLVIMLIAIPVYFLRNLFAFLKIRRSLTPFL